MEGIKKKSSWFRFLTHWLAWAGGALLGLTLYLSVWPLFFHLVVLPRSVPERQGIQVQTYDRPEVKGKPSQAYFSQSDKLILQKPNTSLQAYGLWKISKAGHYRIRLECDDFGTLNLDGLDLIQLSGINALNSGEAEIELDVGYHLIVLCLFNGPGQGWLTLKTINYQESQPLLGSTSLVHLETPNLSLWFKLVKGIEKGCWRLMILSLGGLILLAFFHSDLSRKEIDFHKGISLFMTTPPGEKRLLGGIKSSFSVFSVILFILFGLYSQYLLYKQNLPPQHLRYFKDPVTLFEKRLLEIKPFITSQGAIGYFSDAENPSDFYQTQYSLAPLLVTKDPGSNLVIGVIYDPSIFRSPDFLKNWRIIRDCRNGLVLMERTRK